MDTNLTDKITFPLIVKDKRWETADAASFEFSIDESLKAKFQFLAGQFVTLFLTVNGESLSRSYSISSAPGECDNFTITVKRVPQGKGSNYILDKVHAGTLVKVTPPAGHFFREPSLDNLSSVVLFAAGSGITPVFSITKHILRTTTYPVSLFFCNKSKMDVIYRNELLALEKRFTDRFKIHYWYTQGEDSLGRCSQSTIKNFLKIEKPSSATQFYICGPVGFMNTVKETLVESQIPNSLIREESFGLPLSTPLTSSTIDETGLTIVGDPLQPGEVPSKIKVRLDGEWLEVPADPNCSVLESLLNAGHNPPYSCMDGACMACLGHLDKGRIYQNDPGILTEENLERREILTCQAKPLSKEVVIDFDLSY